MDANQKLIDGIQDGNEAWIKEALDQGADPDVKLDLSHTPLVTAIMRKTSRARMVEIVLKAGADPDLLSGLMGPLHWAVIHRAHDVIRLLTDWDADLSILDGDGFSPFHLACTVEDLKLVQLMIKLGADVSLLTGDGRSVFNLTRNPKIIGAIRKQMVKKMSGSEHGDVL